MKLQKRFIRKYKDKDYYKFIINLPEVMLSRAKLKAGDELEVKVEGEKLILQKKITKT